MLQRVLWLFLSSLFIFGCNKSNKEIDKLIIGEWQETLSPNTSLEYHLLSDQDKKYFSTTFKKGVESASLQSVLKKDCNSINPAPTRSRGSYNNGYWKGYFTTIILNHILCRILCDIDQGKSIDLNYYYDEFSQSIFLCGPNSDDHFNRYLEGVKDNDRYTKEERVQYLIERQRIRKNIYEKYFLKQGYKNLIVKEISYFVEKRLKLKH